MTISITKLRTNLYNIIDEAIRTGRPILITRHGHTLKIVPEKSKSKLSVLKKHPGTIVGNPEDFVHIDWSQDWNEEKNL